MASYDNDVPPDVVLEPYKWSPLNEPNLIRLLIIDPGALDSTISCSILHVALPSAPTFEALSYAWETSEKDNFLRCGSRYVPVTATVYAAIQRLRRLDATRSLWIDAVCIDQENLDEKTQQVRMMKDIFASAQEVLIWLGVESDTDAKAFAILRDFEGENIVLPSIPEFSDRMLRMDGELGIYMARLLHRPWFRRVWVVQEVAVAAKARILCGSQQTPWGTIINLAQFVDSCGLSAMLGTTVFVTSSILLPEQVRKSQAVQPVRFPLMLELLERTQIHSATDPRDSIFALMGIAADATSTGVVVDYQHSCHEIYKEFAIHCVVVHKNFSCFAFAGSCDNTRVPGLPSWTPDWSLNAAPGPRSTFSGIGFTASGTLTSNISLSQTSNQLIICGFVVDVITRVGSESLSPSMEEPYAISSTMYREEQAREFAAIRECDDIALVAQPIYPTGQPFTSEYWRLMVCNRLASGEVIPPRFAKAEEDFRKIILHYDEYLAGNYEHIEMSIIRNMTGAIHYGTLMGKWTSGRAFCSTEKRYLGWVPRSAEVGDKICIFKGAEVPHVLRQQSDGSWIIRGDCYVHGIMEGQALDAGGLEEQSFILS